MPSGGFEPARVGSRDPKAEMKQLANRRDSVGFANWFVTVNSEISEILDDYRFGEKSRANQVAKCRLVDKGAETLAVRQFKSASLLYSQ